MSKANRSESPIFHLRTIKATELLYYINKMTRFFVSLLFILPIVAFANALAGGSDAIGRGEFAYMAAIKFDGKLVCSGSIISPTHILTAANCVDRCVRDEDRENPSFRDCRRFMSISTGSASLSKSGTVSRVKSVKIPENFTLGKFANDIAIITLETPIKFSEHEMAIDLPSEDVLENSVATTSGWGAKSAKDKISEVLQRLEETTILSSKCSLLFKDKSIAIDSNDFCGIAFSAYENAGLCIGDSGNPLIQNGKLIGISTWGIGCAEGYPDVFTNVYRNLHFIHKNRLD